MDIIWAASVKASQQGTGNIDWTMIASIAACVSAFLSLIGILVNLYFNRKTYKANLEINSKLDLLKSVRKLIPDYITAVNYTLYLYEKSWSNENDKKAKKEGNLNPGIIIGETSFEDYDTQLTNAKFTYSELKMFLKIYGSQDLLDDVEDVWNILDKENRDKINSTASNGYISKEEKTINDNFNKVSDKLTEDFAKWYNKEFKKLTK